MHTPKDSSTSGKAAEPASAGWIIDADGREVPITEEMIQQACQELDRHGISSTPQPAANAARSPAP